MTAPSFRWKSPLPSDPTQAAAEWLVRLEDGPLETEARAHFEAWVAADPAHASALAEAMEVWRQAEQLRPHRDELLKRTLPGARVSGPLLTSRHLPKGIAASLILAIAAGFLYQQATAPDFRTAPGEVRTFPLPDGSRLTLGGASAADLAYDGETRRLKLRAGAAYVVAAPIKGLETRPFVVGARSGQSRALGTQFAVEYLDTDVRVTVTEHRVRVTDTKRQALLNAGQSVIYGHHGLQPVRSMPASQTATWRYGRLVFDRTPLRDVVAQLNHYRKDRLFITSPTLSERRVSGVFDTQDPDSAVTSLTTGLNAQAIRTPAGILLLKE